MRSFGTEDRETQFPIAAQNQVYDYILFRGSDIKDIRVCNTAPVPNDPAIMQMHLPQVLQPGNPFQTPHFPMVNMLPGSGGPMGQFGAPGTGGPPYGMGQNLQPGNNLMGNPQQQPPQQQGSVNQAAVGPNNNNISGGGAGDLGGLLVGAGGGGNVVGNNAGPGMLVGIIGSGPGQQQHQQQQQQQVQQQQKNQSKFIRSSDFPGTSSITTSIMSTVAGASIETPPPVQEGSHMLPPCPFHLLIICLYTLMHTRSRSASYYTLSTKCF